MTEGIKLTFSDDGETAEVELAQAAEKLIECKLGGPCRFAAINSEVSGHMRDWCDKTDRSIWDNYANGGCPRKRWDRCAYHINL